MIDKEKGKWLDFVKIINSFENTKQNYPLKSLGMRLLVFLK